MIEPAEFRLAVVLSGPRLAGVHIAVGVVPLSDETIPDPSKVTVSDLGDTPVRIVDAIAFCGIVGTNVGLILTTNEGLIDDKGKVKNSHVIAARLRFDLQTAKTLRTLLDAQIDLLTRPAGQPQ